MNIKIEKKDVIWSYVAQIMNYGTNLLLLPIILKTLPPHEIGIWYIFASITSLIIILDFGFMPNITRFVSYIYSGAKTLEKEGLGNTELGDEIDFNLLKSVIFILKRFYLVITIILILIFSIVGHWYLATVIANKEVVTWAAYYIFCFATCLSFFYSYYDALLLGRGMVKKANQAISYAKIFNLSIASIGLFSGFGIISISISVLISNIVNRYFYHKNFYDTPTVLKLRQSVVVNANLVFQTVWYNSKKLGIVSIGTFLMFQANTLIAGKFFNLKEVASYGLCIQIFTLLGLFSRLYFTTLLPRFNSLWISKDKESLKTEFLRSMKLGWILYFTGTIAVILFGNPILHLIKSNISLPGNTLLILFSIIYLMEITHGNCGIFLTTKNIVPYVWPTIISGVFVFAINIVLVKIFHFKIEAFALSTIIVQFCYNAWKWPYEVIKVLDINFKDLYARL